MFCSIYSLQLPTLTLLLGTQSRRVIYSEIISIFIEYYAQIYHISHISLTCQSIPSPLREQLDFYILTYTFYFILFYFILFYFVLFYTIYYFIMFIFISVYFISYSLWIVIYAIYYGGPLGNHETFQSAISTFLILIISEILFLAL